MAVATIPLYCCPFDPTTGRQDILGKPFTLVKVTIGLRL